MRHSDRLIQRHQHSISCDLHCIVQITRHEQEMNSKHQEMQERFSDVRMDEEYAALNRRMEELAGFREKLDSRFLECVEYEKEVHSS